MAYDKYSIEGRTDIDGKPDVSGDLIERLIIITPTIVLLIIILFLILGFFGYFGYYPATNPDRCEPMLCPEQQAKGEDEYSEKVIPRHEVSNQSNSMCWHPNGTEKVYFDSITVGYDDMIELGEIYIYNRSDNKKVIHRLRGWGVYDDGQEFYLFKGDCNDNFDQPINRSQILYKVTDIITG